MNKLDALKELAAKVEAGKVRPYEIEEHAVLMLWKDEPRRWILSGGAMNAYDGSLDAAKALHEAVLPGWDAGILTYGLVTVWPSCNPDKIAGGKSTSPINPARAWLLAILRALIAQEESA